MGTLFPSRVRWGLKGRLVALTLVVGSVPLLLGIGIAYLQGTRELQTSIGASFAGRATESARNLDLVLRQEIATIKRIVDDPAIVGALVERAADPAARSDGPQRWEARDASLVREIMDGPSARRLSRDVDGEAAAPSVALAAFVTDGYGRLVSSTTTLVPYVPAGEHWSGNTLPSGPGPASVGSVRFDPAFQAYVFDISVPVTARGTARPIGAVHRVFDAKGYFSPLLSPTRFGATGHVMLIDSLGTVIDCPILPTGTKLADATLLALVTPITPGWARTPSDGHGGRTPSLVGFSPLVGTNRVASPSSGTAWHTFAWQSSTELFAPMKRLFGATAAIGGAAIALLAALGYLAAVRIVRPIRQLREGAAKIGRNELDTPLSVRTGDEIEQLAEELNRMNDQLRRAFSGLSQEVRLLQSSNEQILNSVPNPVMLLNDERVQYINRAARRALGVDDRVESGARLFDLLQVGPPSRERLREELRAHLARRSRVQDIPEALVGSQGGGGIPGDPLASPRDDAADGLSNELGINGRSYRYQLFRVDAGPDGMTWTGLVLWDVTTDSRLHEQMAQAEKLAGLGVLTSGIGHELNNPLFNILSLSESIQDEREPARIKAYAVDIGQAAKRMARIIRDFAGASQLDRSDLRDDVSVNEQLDLALRVVGLTHGVSGLRVRRRYHPVPPIRAVPKEIGQVFVSVITNAIQAMKGQGTVDLITDATSDVVVVTIQDSGPGISKSSASKIFDPFFTTKAPGQGTGLGLTVARRIVQRYGGHIRLDQPGGPGATFIMDFPVLHEEVEVVQGPPTDKEPRAGSARGRSAG